MGRLTGLGALGYKNKALELARLTTSSLASLLSPTLIQSCGHINCCALTVSLACMDGLRQYVTAFPTQSRAQGRPVVH